MGREHSFINLKSNLFLVANLMAINGQIISQIII